MKKIKITEKQATLLGLNNIKENEDGVKSVNAAIGEVVIRMILSGENVAKFKDRIIQLIARHDKDAKVGYFEATGKIVGNIKEIKLDSIKRDIKALDPTIVVEKKPLVKSLKEGQKVRISISQYNRLFSGKLLKEEEQIKGGINRVDKEFKKEFADKNVQNIKPANVSEEKFDIKKPNSSMSKEAQGKFMKPVMESEGDGEFKNEVKELVKFLYRKSENLSPFWEKHGITYDAICDSLLSKGLIVSKNGKYEVSKNSGSPQAAMQAIENQLTTLLPKQQGAVQPETEVTEDNYPAGAANDPNAPWNREDPDTTDAKIAKDPKLDVVGMNGEIAILKDPEGNLYSFYYGHMSNKDFMEYASVTRHYVGKDEDGQPEYDYDEDFEINADVIKNYVNDNLTSLSKGEGLEAYENGIDLVKIDEPVKQEILNLYDKDKNIVNALGPIAEVEEQDYDKLMTQFKANMDRATTKPASTETPQAKQSRIVAKLAELKAKEIQRQKEEAAEIEARKKSAELEEMTGTASAGAFTAPMSVNPIKKEMPEEPKVVGETTTVASAGNFQYDTPGGLTMDLGKHNPKTKAEKVPQWAGGSFVKQPECSKPNNNKEAQNGGCNQGASSLKTVKAKGSINAPSLGENSIYEAVAKKTGKSIEEVKKIIESKNNKA